MKVTSSLLAAQAMARITNLSPDDVVAALQNERFVVVDIREKDEVAATGTIPGAVHVPRGLLEFTVDPGSPIFNTTLTPETPVILLCETGHRSALATETLTSLGFQQVAHLSGGFRAWVRQGMPVSYPFAEQAH
ncbi:MAG: rhodanese-like domain-containing protein [Thermomicrobiales bacterium]|nr:rhodanese-like domain-containing protein [Thermomicrobiales bacterium]